MKIFRIICWLMLFAGSVLAQTSKTPIYNGILQSDLDFANYKGINANLSDYAGSGLSWNVSTNKFDVTAVGGTITLTGNVTGSGVGTIPTTIAPGAVTYSKIQNVSANSKLLGSSATGASAAPSEITLGTNLSMSGSTLNATGGGGGTPGGSNLQLQYNNSGAFGGTSGLTWDSTNGRAYLNAMTGGTSGPGLFLGTPASQLGTLQSLDLGGSTFVFFSANKYFTGTAWADLGKSRVGSSVMLSDNMIRFETFDTATGGGDSFAISPAVAWMPSNLIIGFGSSTTMPIPPTVDTGLFRNAAGVMEINNGTAGSYRDLIVRNITINGTCTGAGCGTGGTGSPGGANTNVQYNDSGAFGGDAGLTWDKTNFKLLAKGSLSANRVNIGGDNTSGVSKSTGFNFAANGTGLWQFGNDMNANGGQDFYIYEGPPAAVRLYINGTATSIPSNEILGWQSGATAPVTPMDTGLARNAAGVVEVNNGTAGNFQTLKADVLNAVSGFRYNGSATTGKILIGNGTNIIQSTPAWPTAASTSGKVVTSDGTNLVMSTPTFPTTASVAANKVMASDGTNWTASAATFPTASAASGKIIQSDGTNWVASTSTWPAVATAATTRYPVQSDGSNYVAFPSQITNSSTADLTVSTSDIYLAGSSCQVGAGDFKVKGQYHCTFDMSKTAGTGTPVITARIGTTGSTSDTTATMTFTFGAGTSVADTGSFDVYITFRSVGSGTSAVISGYCVGKHNLATTGMFNNADNWTIQGTTSAGFNSSAATTIGVSFNGGAAFAGTNKVVQASLLQ